MLKQEANALLLDAQLLIDEPDKWGKCHPAYNENGERVTVKSKRACRFCAFGALDRAYHNGSYSRKSLNYAKRELSNAVQPLVEYPTDLSYGPNFSIITGFNDGAYTKHADIMAVFDMAIVNSQ